MTALHKSKAYEANEPGTKFFFIFRTSEELLALDNEEQKLKRLIWDQGYRPSPEQASIIMTRFGLIVLSHIDEADAHKSTGEIKPPRPSQPTRSQTWQGLLRAAKWAAKNYQVKLPSSIDTEMAIEYREFLTCRSGLKISTAGKELRYISSTFATGTTKVLLNSNPFYNLPKDRQSAIRNLLASKKTIDSNNTISAKEGLEINQRMLCSGKGTKDPSYDVFVLQAMTGARIQEIAGLRGCDFIKRRVGETEYHCIRITAWEGRGHGALNGSRGGLKTVQSDRIVPLPGCGKKLWDRYSDPTNRDAAFPEERPRSQAQPWGERLMKRMRDKCKGFKTKSWRETISNNATNAGISYRAVEMVTGKTGESTVVQYTSDDLSVMQKVVEINASCLQIKKWLEANNEQTK